MNTCTALVSLLLLGACATTLTARSDYDRAEAAAADFVVSYTVGARDRITVESWPAPFRGWGR